MRASRNREDAMCAMNLLAYIAPLRFIKGVAAQAIRSMKAPGTAYDDPVLGKDPQPGSSGTRRCAID
jgi:hypothetical protein